VRVERLVVEKTGEREKVKDSKSGEACGIEKTRERE